MSTTQKTGPEVIKAALATMPSRPGVYRMLNEAGDVLYVGKAKHLKNRVASYTSSRQLTTRILQMISQTARLEIVTTESEAEALLLEANMIKSLQPKYNILLKDDKSFPHIHIGADHDFPRIEKHRGARKKKGDYFGPFASVGAVNQTLAILQKAFLLRPCSDTVFRNRSRPCLQYQIKRCSAPCVGYIGKEDYAALLGQARNFLRGKNREIQQQFAEQMQRYSDAMEYEKAAAMRDRIKALTHVQQEQDVHAAGLKDADMIAYHREGGYSVVTIFFFRSGMHFGHQSHFPRHAKDAMAEDILTAFLGQFYQNHTPPKEILINLDLPETSLLEEALSLHQTYRVTIHTPKRGDKHDLMRQAEANAKAALHRHIQERMTHDKQLGQLVEIFALNETPSRIEVYDNSHLMGRHALGAMIVAGPEGFVKKAYRKFNIKDASIEPGDDYGMMREVFRRRFIRLQKDDPDHQSSDWPDLVLIDGGMGQLNAVRQVFEDLGITDIPYVAIAKGPERNAGRERFFMSDRPSFHLPPSHPALYYLQQLRDEAHRFAVGSHRKKRATHLSKSSLDEIPGIGPARKRALLHHFGSADGVEKAGLHELEKVAGISRKTAQQIYDFYHS